MSKAPSETVRIGAWSMLGTAASTSLMARIGADWVVLDAQHGLYDEAALIGSLPSAGVTPAYVRVTSNSPAHIGRALDAGASGIIVPMVQDAAEAAAAASACRYPPRGERSWGPLAAYRGEPTIAPEDANSRVSCAVMVETRRAISDVGAIASTPGVDMMFVGPFDLSIALGVSVSELLADRTPGNPLDAVVAACRGAGARPGAFAGGLEVAENLISRGFTAVAVAVDTQLLSAAGTAMIAAARALPAPGAER